MSAQDIYNSVNDLLDEILEENSMSKESAPNEHTHLLTKEELGAIIAIKAYMRKNTMINKYIDLHDPTNPNRIMKVGIALNGAAIYRRAQTGHLHQEYYKQDWYGKQGMELSVDEELRILGHKR